MSDIFKELLRKYINEQNFTNEVLAPISLNIPRDSNGEFEQQIVPKHERNINDQVLIQMKRKKYQEYGQELIKAVNSGFQC